MAVPLAWSGGSAVGFGEVSALAHDAESHNVKVTAATIATRCEEEIIRIRP
jgi:hypothetical protein